MGRGQTVMNKFLKSLVALTDAVSDNQVAIAKQNRRLQARVENLETRCALQDEEIGMLDARIAAACGMLNLE